MINAQDRVTTELDDYTTLTIGDDNVVILWQSAEWVALSEQAEHRLLSTLLARKAERDNA